jgi:pimeloyl-ACP methyl ester carboxylesterase
LKVLLISGAVLALLVIVGLWLWTPDRDRATLESRYLAAPGDLIEVAGITLHVRDSGPRDAPPIILLHGFGASLHTWEPWARLLSDRYRVIRFDLPGSGLSPPDPTGDYSDQRSMQLLAALMDQLGVARATLVGNSMGGRIAWSFAARHPERVDHLVLISPDGFASPGFEYLKKTQVPASVKLMRYILPKALLRMSLAPAYADPHVLTDALTDRYYDLMLAPGARAAMIERMQQVVLSDPRPWLARISAPTLLLWGEQDRMIPFSNAADYLKAIPNATLVALPGVGHLPQEEIPERSAAALRAFLESPASAPATSVR